MKKNMKKLIWFILLALCFLLIGCDRDEEVEKLCKLEIIEEETSTIIRTIEFMTQSDVAGFFDEEEGEIESEKIIGEEEVHEIEERIEQSELIPEYRIIVYQEKTKTLLSLDNNEEYEKIMEYLTYQESDIVKETIESDAVKNMKLLESFNSYYFHGTEKFFENLWKAVSKEE